MPSLRLIKLLPALLLVLSLSAAAAEKPVLKEFDNPRYENNAFIVISNDISKRFTFQQYRRGAPPDPGTPVGPRNQIRILLDEHAVFREKEDFALYFIPLKDGRKGFNVRRQRRPEDIRRTSTLEEFTITIAPDGSLAFSEVITTRQRGLR